MKHYVDVAWACFRLVDQIGTTKLGRLVDAKLDVGRESSIPYAVGEPWHSDPHEVRLPDELIDLAVSQHFNVVVSDGRGIVRGWWIPDEEGMPLFVTPGRG